MRHHHQPHCFHCLCVHFFVNKYFVHTLTIPLIWILDWWKRKIDNIENWPQLTNDERPACPTCTAASFNYSSGTCTILPTRWKIAEQLHEKFTKGETNWNHVHVFLNVSKSVQSWTNYLYSVPYQFIKNIIDIIKSSFCQHWL